MEQNMTYEQDTSGIDSLGGFAFQIKVFAYYLADIKDGTQIEFETIDDVTIKNFDDRKIDENSENFITTIKNNGSNIAVQVKRTKIYKSKAKKILLNWLLLESSSHNISEYILFTDKNYGNKDILFNIDKSDLYQEILKTEKKENANIRKVKELYKDNFFNYENAYENIKKKYKFVDIDNLDFKIINKYTDIFRHAANEVVYYQRLYEFLQHITYKILEQIVAKKPYVMSHKNFSIIVDDICSKFTTKITEPSYSEFKEHNKIDIGDSQIAKSREYLQLLACELPNDLIEQHLLYGLYYFDTAFKYMENNRGRHINDLQQTTFDNFKNIKFRLKMNKTDKPFNRLDETKNSSNAYATNEQIRHGSCIHLTKENINENQISWEDEDNERH